MENTEHNWFADTHQPFSYTAVIADHGGKVDDPNFQKEESDE